MAKEQLKIGETSKPRFEFRTFGKDFTEEAKMMARLSVPVPKKVWERRSEEYYIVSGTNDINNTKIRDGKMVSYKQFSGIKLPLPSIPEQQKIASVFSSLDEMIVAEQKKIELLEKHKKGLMQGLFPEIN